MSVAQEYLSTQRKALQINLDDVWYGTFAEIGAGQEVARHFFQAGRASHTIAKTMSAYDMVYSDEIYGREPTGRYVCESRLIHMLNHEFGLLVDRLHKSRGARTQFFALASTVATSNSSGNARCQGWMGVRFQTRPEGPAHDIVLHVQMLDKFRLQQQEALGILGVNLMHAAFYPSPNPLDFISKLKENLKGERIEIDMVRFKGDGFGHIDNRLISLELIRQDLTQAVVFGADGTTQQLSDVVFRRDVFVQRGTFRPVTNVNLDILNQGLKQFQKDCVAKAPQTHKLPPLVFLEITMQNLLTTSQLDPSDFIDRIDTLTTLGHAVIVSNLSLFYQLKSLLGRHTEGQIGLVVGASHLEKIFDASYYQALEGGIMEGLGKLFDQRTIMYVYPYKDEQICVTAASWHARDELDKLFQYLLSLGRIRDLVGCEQVQTSLHSGDVRQLMKQANPEWKSRVPPQVSELIEKRKLFGVK